MNTTAWVLEQRRLHWLSRTVDYLELAKPKIAMLVLLVVAVSAIVASWGPPQLMGLFHTLLATAFVAASASALNQLLECDGDRLMERTRQRPLPTGRLSRREVLLFGAVSLLLGIGYLATMVNLQTAWWAMFTWTVYVWVYTPLKSRSVWNTTVGAVAGAAPVLIGWSAVEGRFGIRCAALLLIVLLWQFPHFMAIAWIYRTQYARARLQMATVVEPNGRRAGVQAVLGALALLPVSLVPAVLAPDSWHYLLLAVLLGIVYVACAVAFLIQRNDAAARRLLKASLVYLPLLLLGWALLPFI